MKKMAILGVTAGAATAAIIAMMYRRKDGSRMADSLIDSAKNMGTRLMEYGSQLKDRLLHHVKGPNGEAVYLDMYDRQFYEDALGHRVYMEND